MAFIFHNIWDNPSLHLYPEYQWPFQEPIDWRYLPYTRPMFQGHVRGYTSKIWPYIVLTYLHFRILEFPLNLVI